MSGNSLLYSTVHYYSTLHYTKLQHTTLYDMIGHFSSSPSPFLLPFSFFYSSYIHPLLLSILILFALKIFIALCSPVFNAIMLVRSLTILFQFIIFLILHFLYWLLFLNLGEVYKKLQKMEENHKNTWEEKERSERFLKIRLFKIQIHLCIMIEGYILFICRTLCTSLSSQVYTLYYIILYYIRVVILLHFQLILIFFTHFFFIFSYLLIIELSDYREP